MKKTKRLVGIGFVGILVAIGAAWWWMFVYSNFHTVIDGELYRSAQLSPNQLQSFTEEKKLASIINLRGTAPDEAWWVTEDRMCREANIAYHNFTWTDQAPPSRDLLEAFLTTCRETPKPLLIHCRFGADRTSLGVALYLHHIQNESEEDARQSYSMRFGHVPWLFSKVRIWDELFFTRD